MNENILPLPGQNPSRHMQIADRDLVEGLRILWKFPLSVFPKSTRHSVRSYRRNYNSSRRNNPLASITFKRLSVMKSWGAVSMDRISGDVLQKILLSARSSLQRSTRTHRTAPCENNRGTALRAL
jgi:hypothetical protein